MSVSTPHLKEITASRSGALMFATRKHRGLTQVDVSKLLGIPQGSYSKLEGGLLIPSAQLWFAFCEQLQIPPESLSYPMIETHSPTDARDVIDTHFTLPKDIVEEYGIKIRKLAPLLLYAKKVLGEKKYELFFKAKKISPDYFTFFDHRAKSDFSVTLMEYLLQETNSTPQELFSHVFKTIREMQAVDLIHGELRFVYQRANSDERRLREWVNHSLYYSHDFDFQVETSKKDKLTLISKPRPHVKLDPSRFALLQEYRRAYFKCFLPSSDLHLVTH